MSKTKQLASLALAVMAFAGTSAFAESRHSRETGSRGDARATVRRERSTAGARITVEGRRGDVSRNRSRNEGSTYERRDRSSDRSRDTGRTYERRDRSTDRSREGRYSDTQRYRSDRRQTRYESEQRYRSDRYRSGDSRYRGGSGYYGNRQPYYTRGRVSRCERWGSGYRVWIGGAPYPFYVPLAYWAPSRFRVGLWVSLGGYYNSLGYYDYWDGYRDGYSNSGYRGLSEADFRGTVESVDYRRDSFVVRNDDTGDFITVVLRDRRESLPRSGDYVAVRGDWTTQGYFRAYDVDFLDRDDRDRY